MPGPVVTESRCDPWTTTWSGSPPGASASTLAAVRVSEIVDVATCTDTGPETSRSCSSCPSANVVPRTGMVKSGLPRVPLITAVRPGCPSLKMSTADAPAFWAFSALSWKVQVPRWISATLPAVKPAKSEASQPALEPGVGGGGNRLPAVSSTAPVTSSPPEYVIVAKSVPAAYVFAAGAVSASVGGASSWKNGNSNDWTTGS